MEDNKTTEETTVAATPEHADTALALRPMRGIIPARNRAGTPYDLTTLRKWIRLNRAVFKTDRIDLQITAADTSLWAPLMSFADAEQIRLSPRIVLGQAPLAAFQEVLDHDIHDVCIVYASNQPELLETWIHEATERGLHARVRVIAAAADLEDTERLVAALEKAHAVSIETHCPFVVCNVPQGNSAGTTTIGHMNALARALLEQNTDTSLVGLPFCHVAPENLACALNSVQFFNDHQQYHEEAYTFAALVWRFESGRVSKAIENKLARKTSLHNLIDAALFPWIMDYPRCYIRVWMFHKLTRHMPFMHRELRPLPERLDAYEHALEKYRKRQRRVIGNECASCRFRNVCDWLLPEVKSCFPSLTLNALAGEPLAAAPCETTARPRSYDALDEARLQMPERVVALAEETRDKVARTAPTREISADTYDIAARYTHHMPGAVRWLSFGAGELQSTVLTRLEPPFTIAYTLGGGIAAHAGFAFGRQAKIVCPLIDYSHRLALSVDADGCYVLLRDGQIVRPTEFEGASHVPAKLGGVLEPRISLHNIDGMILTQTVLLWEDDNAHRIERRAVKYSVIIISTRYTRRLQAALLALAHQQGVSPDLYEVIVGYVPGIDATDDLIDTIEATFPDMRVVRMPFAEGRARAKGFMINEARSASSGKWILLMDADIVLPPHTFQTLEAVEEGQHFIAPDGRKMLTPEMSGRILLNELRPWEAYEEIMQGPGEIRKREADGTPIGFFQCVRREVLERNPYHELDHFEASDWHFGRDVTLTYGREYRLKDFYVLHLDHGGSQWYGTHKHR